MRFVLLHLFALFSVIPSLAQDTTDAHRLKQMHYMKMAHRVNCDSTTGTTLEDRICANLVFQMLDSICNQVFIHYLDSIKVDSLVLQEKAAYFGWVLHRRELAKLRSDGYRGNMLGIIYLSTMNAETRIQIKAIEKKRKLLKK